MALVQGLRSINAKFGFDPITATLTFSLQLEDISHPEFTLADDCLSGYFRKHGRHSGENSLFFVDETIGNSRQATPSLFPDFFSTTSCGDTDATRMLKATFDLLQSKKEYMNADVLWITDFKIPLPSPKLTDRILEYRKADTHFYGLQLGIAENEWIPFFDRVYRADYPVARCY